MAKASFLPADAYTPSGALYEGWYGIPTSSEFSDAPPISCVIFQYPNPSRETGEVIAPFCGVSVWLRKLDDQQQPVEAEPVEKVFRLDKDTSKLRPGRASSRDDEDPDDLGNDVGTSGNTVYAAEGAKINANSGWAVFVKSAEQCGVKPAILQAGYLPDWEGAVIHITSQKGEKRKDQSGREIEPNYTVIDKILVYPGEAKTAKKPAAKTANSKAASAPTTTTSEPAAAVNGAVKGASEDAGEPAAGLASDILRELTQELAGETRDAKKFGSMAYSRLVRKKDRDKKHDKAIQEYFRNEEWLIEQSAELGFEFDGDSFTFATAA